MTIHLLTIPDSPDEWPDWLEQQLAGLQLGELVEELRLSRDVVDAIPLNQIFAPDELKQVIRHGLKDVGTEKIPLLLNNPDALLKLQENILLNETTYWKKRGLGNESELLDSATRVRAALSASDNTPSGFSTTETAAASKPNSQTSRRAAIWVAVTALTLTLGGFVWQFQGGGGSPSVLGESNLTANDLTDSTQYFQRIADSGQKWFDEPRESQEQLVALLTIVSRNCETLINAKHEALSAAERDWFVEKCGNWKTKFDYVLASLQAGDITADEARGQSDAVMNKLVEVLQIGPTA